MRISAKDVKTYCKINDKYYVTSNEIEKLTIGDMVFDARIGEYILIETKKELKDLAYAPPELLQPMKRIDVIFYIGEISDVGE